MTFLNPAVLFGLLAASIPVLIHLLNLRKLKKIEFSTLTFLKEMQKNRIKKIKLKQWLLLALRVLIILLLVTAFARPTLEGVAIGGTTSAAKTTSVFIIDDTFSMTVVDANGSYLNQAKETIRELINNLQEGDEAALIRVSGRNSDDVKPSNNLGELINKLSDIEPAFQSGYMHNAVVKASGVLSESRNFNKEIYIFSDFQKSKIFETGSISDLSQMLGNNVKIYSFNYSGKDVFNAGIEKIEVETEIFEKEKPVAFSTSVRNFSTDDINNLVVSLFVNNERTAQQSLNLAPGSSSVVTMEALLNKPGYNEVFAEIEDDEIFHDNRRYTSVYNPEKIPVIIFYDDINDIRFIELALQSAGNSEVFSENKTGIVKRNLNQLSSVNLNRYEAVFIIGAENLNNTEQINDYVENGGGVFVFPGSNTSEIVFQNMLKSLNLPAVQGVFGKKDNTDNTVNFGRTEFNHPVFQNIFADGVKRNIESPDIFHHFRITSEGKGITVISLMNNSSFLSEYKSGKGKILLCSTSPVLSWSDFPLKGIFAPLINKSVFYLATGSVNEESYLAGDNININISNRAVSNIKIVRPDVNNEQNSFEEFIKHEDINSDFFSYGSTDFTGILKIFSGEELIKKIPVNIDPLESDITPVDVNGFENYLSQINFKGSHLSIDKDQDPVDVVLQARFGSELWKLFLLAAILTALIEMVIARSVKKEIAETA